MAIVGSGVWVQGSAANSSQQDRSYFSGDVAVNNATYDDTHEYLFGFSTPELHVYNTGGAVLVFQWMNLKGVVKDSGVVPANSSIVFRCANKTGIRLRQDAGNTTARVIAVG